MSKKQSKKKSPNTEQPKVDTPERKQSQAKPTKSAQPEPPLTLESLKQQLDDLAQRVQHHAERILCYDTIIKRRHKMTSNGSVQILDKVAGKVYPSKNSTFQSLMLVK